jgi:hypothetical protein
MLDQLDIFGQSYKDELTETQLPKQPTSVTRILSKFRMVPRLRALLNPAGIDSTW